MAGSGCVHSVASRGAGAPRVSRVTIVSRTAVWMRVEAVLKPCAMSRLLGGWAVAQTRESRACGAAPPEEQAVVSASTTAAVAAFADVMGPPRKGFGRGQSDARSRTAAVH
ncbi:hypothetical protein GCM10020219_032640 [Nonomuraea dietziae]